MLARRSQVASEPLELTRAAMRRRQPYVIEPGMVHRASARGSGALERPLEIPAGRELRSQHLSFRIGEHDARASHTTDLVQRNTCLRSINFPLRFYELRP